jgi:chromosome segregation ATPase
MTCETYEDYRNQHRLVQKYLQELEENHRLTPEDRDHLEHRIAHLQRQMQKYEQAFNHYETPTN